jgi:outer membrane protein assembly factor BamB
MFRGTVIHSGVYKLDFTGTTKEFAWTYKTGGAVRSSSPYYNRNIYVGSTDHYLYAINAESGELVWKFLTGGSVTSSPAVDVNGNIIFQSAENTLYSVNSIDGSLNWEFESGKDLQYQWGFDYSVSSPAINENAIYFGSGDGNMYALNDNDGILIWKYNTGNRVRTSPAVYNNIVLFGDVGGHFYSLCEKDGKVLWKFDTKGGSTNNNLGKTVFDRTAIISSPAVDDNMVCFGARDGFLYALNKVGEATAWIKNYGGPASTGIIQLWIDNSTHEDLTFIQQIAEFND